MTLIQKIAPLLASPGLRRAGLVFSARAVNPVVSLVFSLVMPRILTVEDFGIYGWALARIFVVQAFAEVGLQQSLIRFLVPALRRDDPLEFRAVLRASLQLKFYALAIIALLASLYTGCSSASIFSSSWRFFCCLNRSLSMPVGLPVSCRQHGVSSWRVLRAHRTYLE